MCKNNCILSVCLGLVLGALSALAWYFGLVLYARAMLPYALVFGMLLFITTAILIFVCSNKEDEFQNCACRCIRKLSPLVLICAAIFIIVALIVLATYLSLTVRIILAVVGSISFWIMLLVFISMILSRPCRR